MAVYTTLSAAELAGLVADYNVGALVSAKGIAEGVSNSNWLVETTQGRFILTMYEARVAVEYLPVIHGYFAQGCGNIKQALVSYHQASGCNQ